MTDSSSGRKAGDSPGGLTTRQRELLEPYAAEPRAAERAAAGEVDPRAQFPVLAVAVVVLLVTFFLPHSGEVKGIDVLFNTRTAQDFLTTVPERVYAWLAFGAGCLLTVGTLVSRSAVVAWVNWALAGVGWWYGIFAIWMRQSRPPTEPGVGPSYGLIIGVIALFVIFATMFTVILQRTSFQRALAALRREDADKDGESQARQQVLRAGLPERDMSAIPDDRRRRAKERRARRRAAGTGGSAEGGADS
ncbi:hypothetical protein [Corynebacterium bovis]|uniref:Rv2732c family membrane protein n=1 Tax=Corynebacterium bovis TaxID=36808 RepID=UPI003139C384